eukprot:gb/GFBE01029561.1/.p1 GENE.gb/GFBE01029561.1/~~gb/GFBE01029561.1/.p1  ORF type:complete len:632 (+),score=110.56 gb/GFBE01029561.1/:1-1896(+)
MRLNSPCEDHGRLFSACTVAKAIWATCFCAPALAETISSRVWRPSSSDFVLPELEQGTAVSTHLNGKADVGLALAGGGMRGLAIAHGVLRSLREAELLEKVKYVSLTSGSVWLGLPLYYQELDTLDDYLGKTMSPEQLTREVLTSRRAGTGISRLTHFDQYPKSGGVGDQAQPSWSAIKDFEATLIKAAANKFARSLKGVFDCPEDEGWCACAVERLIPGLGGENLMPMFAAYVFLHPFGLAEPGSTHCHESQLERVRELLGRQKVIYTAKDVSRGLPFLLSQSALLAPYTGLDAKDPLVTFPIEQTPLYAGIFPAFRGSKAGPLGAVGDLLLEPFAFGSRIEVPLPNGTNGDKVELRLDSELMNAGQLGQWQGMASAYVADFQVRGWADKIPRCLIAGSEKMMPHANLWSPLELDQQSIPVNRYQAVGDAGIYDDLGHIPLLRRKVSNIVIVDSAAIRDDVSGDKPNLCEMTYIFAAFGQPGCLDPPNPPGAPNPKAKANWTTVFEPSEFPHFWEQVLKAWNATEPAIIRGRYTVVDNENFGIEGGWVVEVLWVLLFPSKTFRSAIPAETDKLLPPWFPNSFASKMNTRFEMSAASQFASWLTQRELVTPIADMIGEKASGAEGWSDVAG